MSDGRSLPAKPPAKPGENRLQNHLQCRVKTGVKPGEHLTPHTPCAYALAFGLGHSTPNNRKLWPSGQKIWARRSRSIIGRQRRGQRGERLRSLLCGSLVLWATYVRISVLSVRRSAFNARALSAHLPGAVGHGPRLLPSQRVTVAPSSDSGRTEHRARSHAGGCGPTGHRHSAVASTLSASLSVARLRPGRVAFNRGPGA